MCATSALKGVTPSPPRARRALVHGATYPSETMFDMLKDLVEYWGAGKTTWDPEKIRVPTLLILAEWDQDTPLYMAQELFAKLVNTPHKRHVVIGDGTHTVAVEKNRMHLINQVQSFLDE